MKSQPKEEPDFDITKYNKCGGDLYWHGCYDGDSYFKQYFDNSTYAHPAKISPLLVERIFKHLEHLGILKEGMTILDFMAGSGRVPLMASLRGYKSIGVELEPHFTKMCEDNKKFAENKIGRKLDMEIIQGDSRQLSKLLKSSDVAVLSPPYFESGGKSNSEDNTLNQRNPISLRNNYSLDNPPNIGNLKYKEMIGIVSPPFIDQNSDNKKYGGLKDISKVQRKNSVLSSIKYSQNPNNIGNLKDKGFVGITSPPYENSDVDGARKMPEGYFDKVGGIGHTKTLGIQIENPNNIGSQVQENYLSAMLQVYKEASKVCPVICTITKNPTRAGKLRRLDIDTKILLEKSGYKIIDYHRAVLFKTHEQHTLTGEIKKTHKGRLSFFKRLSLAKGNLASEWEDILVGVKT